MKNIAAFPGIIKDFYSKSVGQNNKTNPNAPSYEQQGEVVSKNTANALSGIFMGGLSYQKTKNDVNAVSQSDKNTDEYDMYMVQKAKCGTLTMQDIKDWSDREYQKIRQIDYTKQTVNPILQRVTDTPFVGGIKTYKKGGWTYRRTGEFRPVVDRASLNVVNDPNLITELDYFMKTGMYKYGNSDYKVDNIPEFSYKTPSNAALWYTREDPVSLYFYKEVDSQTYQALVRITSKYRNGALHNAKGENVDWFAVEKNPGRSLIEPLMNEAFQTNLNLGCFIYNEATDSGKKDYVLSAGQYEAFKNILKKIKS